MEELYESEGPMRFCRLTLRSNDDQHVKRITLWLSRVMDADGYSRYEDYSLGVNEWEMCLTGFERRALENYLWENKITDFVLEEYVDQKRRVLTATAQEDVS